MGDHLPRVRALIRSWTRWRMALLTLAVGAWLLGFALLLRLGTWLPLAVVGPALAWLALWSDRPARALVRLSAADAGVGLAVGLAMVLATHGSYALVSSAVPEAGLATERLFHLLNVGGFTPGVRAGLIVLIASSEEVLFRGALLGDDARDASRSVGREGLVRVLLAAVVYALAMTTLGSSLLILCTFCCGVAWGLLRMVTGALTAPIVAHVVWDLGVLVVWPLTR